MRPSDDSTLRPPSEVDGRIGWTQRGLGLLGLLGLLALVSSCGRIGYDFVSQELDAASSDASLPSPGGPTLRLSEIGEATVPTVVWTGGGFSVAWEDYRHGNGEIYLGRIDALAETIIGETRITSDSGDSVRPRLVWSGSEHGLVWDNSLAGGGSNFFAALELNGTLAGGISTLTADPGESRWTAVAATPTGYGVAWTDGRDGQREIYFALLDTGGQVVGAPKRITNDAAESSTVDLLWTGSGFALVYEDARTPSISIYYSLLDATGNKVGVDVLVVGNETSEMPDIAPTGDGDDYGLVFRDDRDGGESELYFARLDVGGRVVGTLKRVTNTVYGIGQPAIVSCDTSFGVAWRQDSLASGNSIRVVRLDWLGERISSELTLNASPGAIANLPSITCVGAGFGVAWQENTGSFDSIYFRYVEP